MSLVPYDYPFVFAPVKGGNLKEKTSKLCEWASFWLKFKSLCGKQGAVVFDIDDTLVDGKENNIIPVVKVYRLALALGFLCYIVTARPESPSNRRYTREMLSKNGIANYQELYMMPSKLTPTFQSISLYKFKMRTDISKQHEILCNIGDMWTDHLKYPCKFNELQNRDVSEGAIFFFPATYFPCIKLPGSE